MLRTIVPAKDQRVKGIIHRTAAIAIVCLIAGACSAQPELELIARTLNLEPGMHVADIGAGEGEYAVFLAEHVGPSGRVYATELDAEAIAELEQIAAKLENLEVLQASATATGLAEACCDVLFMRNVYHHLSHPRETLTDLRRAIRPGGFFLVIDFEPSALLEPFTPDDVPEDRGGHGVPPSIVIDETRAAGFAVVEQIDEWPGRMVDQFAVLLRAE